MTRALLIAVLLSSGVAFAAGTSTRSRKSKPAATRKAEPPPKAKSEAKPAPAPKAAAERDRTEPAKSPFELRVAFGLGAGGFFAGGANRGPAAAAHVTLVPELADGRFSLDVELGWRMATFTTRVDGYGALTSSAHTLPLVPALRFRAFRAGLLTLDLRGGVGLLMLVHRLSSDFAPSATRTGLGWEGFAGAQVRVPVSSFELFLDLRYALGEAPVPFVLGRATGLQGLLGVRYAL